VKVPLGWAREFAPADLDVEELSDLLTHRGVKVEGSFELNEFAALSGEDLHLLRIFVLAEGRIRDMEAPLGLSYPTIRVRLKALRERVAARLPAGAPARGTAPAASARPKVNAVDEILGRLEAGELSFEQAMELVKKAKR